MCVYMYGMIFVTRHMHAVGTDTVLYIGIPFCWFFRRLPYHTCSVIRYFNSLMAMGAIYTRHTYTSTLPHPLAMGKNTPCRFLRHRPSSRKESRYTMSKKKSGFNMSSAYVLKSDMESMRYSTL